MNDVLTSVTLNLSLDNIAVIRTSLDNAQDSSGNLYAFKIDNALMKSIRQIHEKNVIQSGISCIGKRFDDEIKISVADCQTILEAIRNYYITYMVGNQIAAINDLCSVPHNKHITARKDDEPRNGINAVNSLSLVVNTMIDLSTLLII